MENDNEPYSSIIPQAVLDVALAAKEVPVKVRKRLYDMDSDPLVEADESLGEKQIKSKMKKSSSKQGSVAAPFTVPSSSLRWEPLHKKLSAKKTLKSIKKRIAIDPPELETESKISSVLTEDQDGKKSKDFIQRTPNTTTQKKKKKEMQTLSKPPGTTNLNQSGNDSTSSAPTEIVELECAHVTHDSESLEYLEILREVSSSPTSSPNKLLSFSTPRLINRGRRRDNAKMAQTTPRRKISQQRSFSPLHFNLNDEECNIPETPVVRRRRPGGETSVFDLNASGEEGDIIAECSQRLCSSSASCSLSPDVTKVHLTESPTTVLDDTESDAAVEVYDATVTPSTSTSDCFGDDLIKDKRAIFGSYSSHSHTETETSANKSTCDEESRSLQITNISYRYPGVENEEDRTMTPAKHKDDLVLLNTVQVTPSKSRYLSPVLYSPRKMELNNSQRLRIILGKTRNNFDYFPNLGELLPHSDYCAFQVPSISKDKPPLPSPETCENTELNFGNPLEFVRLPWSTANVVSGFHHYIIIDRALRALVHDGAHCIEAVIVTLRECAPWLRSFDGLLGFMDCLSPSEEREILDIIAGIAKLAVNAKFILTSPVPILRANRTGSVTLSQEQCACLLAHAFFCTYRRERNNFNRINMASIFDGRNPMCHVKLRFILHYFSIVVKKMPVGCVSFRREALSSDRIPNWEEDQTLIPLMAVASDASIEDSHGCLQVDFANEYIGGGVISWGAVQEEIRFLICPEMIISCLLCEKMGPLEVIHIVGAQRYSSYFGYGNTLRWAPYEDFGSEPRDDFCRVKCEVVAMDATLFMSSYRRSQYDKVKIDRELNKAYVGFMTTQREAPPIATGNWGCGVFGGDKELKILIQLMAAGRAGRDMIYYTFGNPSFEYCVNEQYEKMVQKKASIGTVYKALTSYQRERERNPYLSVFDHVYAVLSEIACTAS